MSGIAGVLRLDGAPADRAWLEAATEYLAFCGPDAHGCWRDGVVGLGYTLLRTTFEAAHEQQPYSADGQVQIVADARLDARDELRAALAAHGHDLAPHVPDVELIWAAYAVWGEACVDQLMGDFAFALWDGRQRRLFCARDHFGVTPFYFVHQGNLLLVSNVLNALRLHPDVPDTLSEEAIGEQLLFSMRPASDITIYAAIRRLRPAHTLTAGAGEVRIRRYWQPAENAPIRRGRRSQEIIEEFRQVFTLAVKDRLRTDRVGTALSGGLDSTSIAATANRLLQANDPPGVLRGATMTYNRLIPDQEGMYAQLVAKHSGFATDLFVTEDYINREPDWSPAYALPEPWGLPGMAAEEAINRHVATYACVYLMGFGGDPLLAPTRVGWSRALRNGYFKVFLGAMRRRWRARRHPPLSPPAWIQPSFVQSQDLYARWDARMADGPNHNGYRGMADDSLWDNIFMVADPGFTGVPVKARFPFFDLRVYTFIGGLPPQPWSRHKYLLRQAMRDILPPAIIQRPKTPLQGFPFHRQLQEHGIPNWMKELVRLPELEPYVDSPAILRLLETRDAITPFSISQLGSVLAFAYWLKCRQHPALAHRPEVA